MVVLKGRRVLIGVTGGIAAYKVAYLVRELKRSGACVRVVMTPFAQNFISSLTFEVLSGEKVYVDWSEDPLAHINLARWAEVFLIAPCTVNTLSKLAMGIGDNLLTATALAWEGTMLVAPAANTVMYKNPAAVENISRLKKMGVHIIEPEWGRLACEEEGEGKLADLQRLIDWVCFALSPKPLSGKRVLITCGSTREPIDPVRFISNHSSGEMGFALARVSRWMGAKVKVIAGFTTAEEPPEIQVEKVSTAEEMLNAVLSELSSADVVIMNAAVSDYRPKEVASGKMKKKDMLTLELEKTPDILKTVGERKGDRFVVGFALESEDLLQGGKEKLKEKGADMIVANPLDVMGAKHHRGYLITDEKVEEFEFEDKLASAFWIMDRIAQLTSPQRSQDP